MSDFNNSGKQRFLNSRQRPSIEDDAHNLAARCKFNFSYFDEQRASQGFDGWDHGQLVKLLEKLKHYSKESLVHWKRESVGKHGNVLSVYEKFPTKTDFTEPMHIPHQAYWARFRLESGVRLIGFVLPDEYRSVVHAKTTCLFDCNTFYIVFLDANHCFYKTELK